MLSVEAKRFSLLRESIRILKRVPYLWITETNCGFCQIVYRSSTVSVWNIVRSDIAPCSPFNNPMVVFCSD
jgi:hypothetical protein